MHLRKEERSKIKNLSLYFKRLYKKKHLSLKQAEGKRIIAISPEMNELENQEINRENQ